MQTHPDISSFWEVRNRLSSSDNVVWLDNNRIVIPESYTTQILKILHSAHQGVSTMTKRANPIVYWPGIYHAIRNIHYSCDRCNKIVPSHSNEPIVITKTPKYPFQFICADYFEVKGQNYLPVVDRFSGWIMLYHYPPSKF